MLKKVFGEATLKDTAKAVLIPCYDLATGAPLLFSRADALEMDSCDFRMAELCEATLADRAVHLKSTDGITKILAVGGRVGMSNPAAAAITHVLNNKQEFPLCNGVEDLLVVSLGNGESNAAVSFAKIAADGAADMVRREIYSHLKFLNIRKILVIIYENDQFCSYYACVSVSRKNIVCPISLTN